MTPVQLADLGAALSSRYAVERELGRGGMATVYLARDRKHDRPVAIKVLHPEIASALGPERFLHEIETVARLNHPHILPLHDSGSANSLLYYVMPYAEGETLRDRLDREKQLPLSDAIKIARDVSAALDFAHDHGIVHRDIKPENILLEGDEAVVADFGIARAVSEAGGEKLTETGFVLGTPTYMSPEQGAGDDDIDRRSDVYSLGCVVYEMLAGEPPFTGATSRAIFVRHLQEPPPPLHVVRPDLPAEVEAAISIALAKAPADRFASTRELVESVTGATRRGPATRPRRRKRTRWAVAAGTVVVAAALVQTVFQPFASAPLDPALYVVAPFEVSDGGDADLAGDEAQRLMAETIREWEDVSVVDEHQLSDAVSGRDSGGMSNRAWFGAARSLGAAWLVRGTLTSSAGDAIRVSASLFDVRKRSNVRQAELRVAADSGAAVEAFRRLAGELFGLVRPSGSVPRSTSLRATRQFLAGLDLLDRGELAVATDSFRAAAERDRNFAAAQLWVAQATAWAGDTVTEWQPSVQAAARLRDRLSDSLDRALAKPLLDLAQERYADACREFRTLLQQYPSSYAAWFGLAECHARDHAVLPDPESATGWRFRSSYAMAAEAYREGLEIVPFMTPGLYSRLTEVLQAEPNTLRWGRPLPPDTGLFVAYPGIDPAGDTLAYVPCPVAGGIGPSCEPSTNRDALARNRRELLDAAQQALSRGEFGARHLRLAAEALELNDRLSGNSIENSALTAARRALERADAPDDSLAAAIVETRILLKLERFEAAAERAAETLARWPAPDPWTARQLVPIATLLGRPEMAADLGVASAPSVQTLQLYRGMNLPLPVLAAHEAAVPYAAIGAPADTVAARLSRLEALLRSTLSSAQAAEVRCMMLGRVTALAFPELRRPIEDENCRRMSPLYQLQFAFAEGDEESFDEQWSGLAGRRRDYRAGDITADFVFQESWLLAAAGDTAAATAHLDRSLEAIATYPPSVLSDPAQAGGLVRAMALRAELAAQAGDKATARRWANAVAILWNEADPALQAQVDRLRALNR